MNKQLKAKWVKALREKKIDGRPIRQARGVYRRTKSCFCSIGVLLHCINPNGWERTDHKYYISDSPYDWFENVTYYCNNHNYLTKLQINEIIEMNDFELLSFSKIADWIEENI